MRSLSLFLVCLTSLLACRSLETGQDSGLAWVAEVFSGGVQCDPESDYTPPDTRALLEQADVRVSEIALEHLAVAAVCGASSYAATHYPLIDARDVEVALELGFERSDAPPDWAQR